MTQLIQIGEAGNVEVEVAIMAKLDKLQLKPGSSLTRRSLAVGRVRQGSGHPALLDRAKTMCVEIENIFPKRLP